MKYHYAASTMGQYGQGRFWHKMFNFPDFTRTSKTFTIDSKLGTPFLVFPFGNSVWNRVGLHNPGMCNLFFQSNKFHRKFTVSIAGTDNEIYQMLDYFRFRLLWKYFDGIELNFSCPNIPYHSFHNRVIPSNYGLEYLNNMPLYLKLSHNMRPDFFNGMERIKRIRVNSVGVRFGAISGKAAQEKNWSFIERWIKEGYDVSGCSIYQKNDINRLEDMGCTEISLGSVLLTNPNLVKTLYEDIRD